jgi:DNA-binding MarR family transcriptional regulator
VSSQLPKPPPARTSALATELRAAVSKMTRRLGQQTSIGDLNPSQVVVLQRLDKEAPITASGLARSTGMRPQSMASVIAALQNVGLVSGAPDPADKRQTLLSLSEAGQAWVRQGRAARHDWLTRTLHERLTPEEQKRLADALELLKRLVDD